MKRLLIDFATGRGLVLWGSCMISDERWIFRSEPAEQCPGKYCEQGYPDKSPKQGDHLSKKFMIKSKHKRLSFLVFGLYLGESRCHSTQFSLFFKTHALNRTMAW